jgi:hypothetical protein
MQTARKSKGSCEEKEHLSGSRKQTEFVKERQRISRIALICTGMFGS